MSKSSSPSLKDSKRAAAQAALLDAAEVELANGLANASMQAIAERAGVSVGTLYNYFKDKDGLVRELLEERRARLRAAIEEVMRTHDEAPFQVQLRALLTCIFGFFDEHRAYLRISTQAEEQAITKLKTSSTILANRLKRIVDRGIAEGAIREAAAPLAVAVIIGVMKAVLMLRIEHKGSSLTDLVDESMNILLRGIGT